MAATAQGIDEHEAARRRKHWRRRFGALGAAMLVLAVLAHAALPGSGKPKPRVVARPIAHVPVVPQLTDQQVISRVLATTSYIARGQGAHREIALTFDDGPGPYTEEVARALVRAGVKATFFEIGRQIPIFSDAAHMLVADGMAIGDHTQDHPPLATLSVRDQAGELDNAAAELEAEGAGRPLLFRPPYGSFNAVTLKLLAQRGMLMVLWSADTEDYRLPGEAAIVRAALAGARPGAIILFHDGGGNRSETVAAIPIVVRALRRRGYTLVTVPQLLRDDPPPAGQPPPTNLSGG